MRPKTTQRKSRSRKTKPMTSREKVRAHRARLRAQGMRPITLWVPDMRSPKFAAEARRQCILANNSPYAAEDQAWVDSMSDWNAD
jgi:Antitoxin MazE-like